MDFDQQNPMLFHGTIFASLQYPLKCVRSSYDQMFDCLKFDTMTFCFCDYMSGNLYQERICQEYSVYDICVFYLSAVIFRYF